MDSVYKQLFDRGLLKGDKINSPISLQGIESLSNYYKNKYKFIDINIVNQDKIYYDIIELYSISQKYLEEHEKVIPEKVDEAKDISDAEDYLFDKIQYFNKKKNTKENDALIKEIKDNSKLFSKFQLFNIFDIKLEIDLVCKQILKEEKKRIKFFYMGGRRALFYSS